MVSPTLWFVSCFIVEGFTNFNKRKFLTLNLQSPKIICLVLYYFQILEAQKFPQRLQKVCALNFSLLIRYLIPKVSPPC